MSKFRNEEYRREIYQYITQIYCNESELQRQIREECENSHPIQIGAIEGKLISLLISMTQPKKILEIGTLYGYSLSWILSNLHSKAEIISIDNNPENIAKAKNFLQDARITFTEGIALDILEKYAKSKQDFFDLIFIDADKSNYLNYLNLCDNLLKPGGILIADNTLLFGTIANITKPNNVSNAQWASMQKFNRTLNEKYNSLLLPIGDGISIGIKKISTL